VRCPGISDAREARQIEDNNELHPAFGKAAVLEQLLELSPVSGLRALACLAESRQYFEALTLAVFLAGLELRRQTQSGSGSALSY